MSQQYRIIDPAEVQPGDMYKFVPLNDGEPIFRPVLDVLLDQNLVQVGPNGLWVYMRPPLGKVVFARKQK
jgi:hypothetical protein